MLHAARGGEWRTATGLGSARPPVTARWLVLPDGSAVVDSAEAVGLPLVGVDERDPLRASTRGLGELLLAILAEQPREVLVGVGGTATVDGGAGMREVVGSALRDARVRVLCDVRNPLLGERGAARVFGPQKGADPRGGRGARAAPRVARRARAVPRPARGRRGRRPRRRLRGARRRALRRCGARPRHDRLRRARAARRPGRHRGGRRRPDDARRQGARRGRSPLRDARRARACSSAASCATASTRGRCRATRRARPRISRRSGKS